MSRWLLLLPALIFIGWLLIVGFFYFYQTSIIFLQQPLSAEQRSAFQSYAVSFENQGEQLQGWYWPADPDKPLLIYYGGNSEEISWNLPYFRQHIDASLLLINYRGYGASTGEPSAKALKADALAIFDQIQAQNPQRRILLMGRSLGSGVATYVAHQRPVAGVMLVTPFDSLAALGSHHYPWIPVNTLLRQRFPSAQLAQDIHAPLLCLIAEKDLTVPAKHGERLWQAWAGPKQLVHIENANHLNITDAADYWPTIGNFIEEM